MGIPLHKWRGVTFLHASVGAWFLYFIKSISKQFALKINI